MKNLTLFSNAGRISEQGSYKELMDRKGDFAELVIQFLSEALHESDEDKEELELLNEFKDKLPAESLERSKSFQTHSQIMPSKPGKMDSMRSFESSRVVSYQQSGTLKRSSSMLSRSSIQLENDKKIEKQQKQESLRLRQKKGKLIGLEHMEIGSVKKKVYWEYIKALKVSMYVLTIFSYLISHIFNVFSQLWLSQWSDDSIDPKNFNNTALRNKRLIGYGGLGAGEMVFSKQFLIYRIRLEY